MRRIKIFFEVLCRQFIIDLKVNIIIIFTLSITLAFMFFISAEVFLRYSEYGDLGEGFRTYEIRISGKNSVNAFDSILKEFKKKSIEKITQINLTARKSNITHFNLSFNGENGYLNPMNMFKEIEVGRDFSENELKNGENVVILSEKDYSSFYSDHNINDKIIISGYQFKLIGISKNNDEGISSIIPFQTLLKISQHNDNPFHINEVFVTLEKKISKKEIRKATNTARSNLKNADYHISTSSSWMITSKLRNISGSVIAALLVMALCILNIVSLLKILKIRNNLIMKIYQNLGYGNKNIILTFVFTCFLLLAISGLIGNYMYTLLGFIKKIIFS